MDGWREGGRKGLQDCKDALVRAVRGTGMLLTAVQMITESVNDVFARAPLWSLEGVLSSRTH